MFTTREVIKRLDEIQKQLKPENESDKEYLEGKIKKLKEQVSDLEYKHKQEKRDIEHLVKIKEEKLNIEFEKRETVLRGELDKKLHKVKDEYHNKLLNHTENSKNDVKEMYSEILSRLPNINAHLKGKM